MYHGVSRLPLITRKTVERRGYQSARLIRSATKSGAAFSFSKEESISISLSLFSEFYVQKARLIYSRRCFSPPCSMRVALQFLNNVCFTEIAARITRADQITLARSLRKASLRFPRTVKYLSSLFLRKSEAAADPWLLTAVPSEWTKQRFCDSQPRCVCTLFQSAPTNYAGVHRVGRAVGSVIRKMHCRNCVQFERNPLRPSWYVHEAEFLWKVAVK